MSYQAFQLRVTFEKDAQKQEAMWERQHKIAADKIYNMCSDMGGFFLKVYSINFFSPFKILKLVLHGFAFMFN